MKKHELEVGRTYSNGKGALRRILARGPEYTLIRGQIETDNLAYAIVSGKRAHLDEGKTPAGKQIRHSTAASFAAWAKAEHRDPRP